MRKIRVGKMLPQRSWSVSALAVTWLVAYSAFAAAQATEPAAPGAPAVGHREATIAILAQTSRVCPGQPIGAKYVERLADGSHVDLPPSEVRQFPRSDDESVAMLRDGSWQTNANPMRTVLTGFRLSVALLRDSSVRGDTIVAPSYDCSREVIRLPVSDQRRTTSAYVRLGTFKTPFYDSVVVAVVELETRPFAIVVLSPSQMRAGAISISALGKSGAAGRSGRQGASASDCSNGDDGEDGEDGEPGQPGGQVDIITQTGSPWLADLVAVSNAGGRGGKGGIGGAGGAISRAVSGGRGSTCRARPGRTGKAGRQGPDGESGRPPRVTSVLIPLLWQGSPIWSDTVARRSIEELMAYDAKRPD